MMDVLVFTSVLLLSSLSGTVHSCKTAEDFKAECMDPYTNYLETNNFWTNTGICSVQGKENVACIKYQSENCGIQNDQQRVFFEQFNETLSPFAMNINFACEIYLSEGLCLDALNCKPSSIGSYQGTSIYSFYEFLCGKDEHLHNMFNCTKNLETTCPFSVALLFSVATPTGILDYSTLSNKTLTECGKLTDQDTQCIESKGSEELAKCNIRSTIDIPRQTLTCDYPDQFKPCVAEECGDTVASFYYEMFQFLECRRNVDGKWSGWSAWSTCDATCDEGTTRRTRECNNPPQAGQGSDCAGESTEEDTCNIKECPVDGQFGIWGFWSACGRTCGEGTRTRTRSCNQPAPAHGGSDCVGVTSQSESCNDKECPGVYTTWTPWGSCSETCGSGMETRSRTCVGGNGCSGPSTENRDCFLSNCPGGYTTWTPWGSCSETCGSGMETRSRTCVGGNGCSGPSTENRDCFLSNCPGVYSEWNSWGSCSKTCGNGTETRSRTCVGGNGCSGPSMGYRDCFLSNCRVDGGFSDWTVWSACTKTCGGGTRTKTRSCTEPAPAFGGSDCDGELRQTEACNEQTCLASSCPQEKNSYGTWPGTIAGQTSNLTCQEEGEKGGYSRRCGQDGTWDRNVSGKCEIDTQVLDELNKELQRLSESKDNVSGEVENIVKNLTDLTEGVDSETSGETLQQVVQTAKSIADVIENSGTITKGAMEDFLRFTSNIIRSGTTDAWNDEQTEVDGSDVLIVMDRVVAVAQGVICDTLSPGSGIEFDNENIYTEIAKPTDGVTFPKLKQTDSLVEIHAASLEKKGITNVCFAGSDYQSIGNIIESGLSDDGSADSNNQRVVNTAVVSVKLPPMSGVTYKNLDPPVRVTLNLKNDSLTNPVCVFWDDTKTGAGNNGGWSSEGCVVADSNATSVVCECSHLTNFAVLMSPSGVAGKHSKILSIISAVGCAISMVCLILTIAAHVLVWRLVRSDRAIILMNLCVALLVALGVFLAGVNRTESSKACAAIAAIIQYLFLAVFFFMLLIGIEILICVVHVFVTKFRIKILLPVAWVAPAVIVGISLGVTKGKGYGNDNFCWLDIDSGLIWSFIGPAIFIIFVNFIIILIVFKKMASSAVLKSKTSKTKLKTGLRSLCVLLPLMGLTWVFGVLSVNSTMFFLQYLFSILNSLQGLFIFLFHCVFNRQIRDALKRRQDRRRSLQTFSSDLRKQSRSHSKDVKQLSPSSERPPSDLQKNGLAQMNGVDNKAYDGRKRRSGGIDYEAEDWDKLERKMYHKNIRSGEKVSS